MKPASGGPRGAAVLIVADPADVGALRVAAALRRRGAPTLLVSIEQLLLASGWSHDPLGETEITLGNGTVLNNEGIGAVFCRARAVDPPQFARAGTADRIYAQEEFYALFLSWLEQLGPKVHNRPHAGSLNGTRGTALEDRLWLGAQGAPVGAFAVATSVRRLAQQSGVAAPWCPGQDEAALAGLPFAPVPETLLAGRPAVRVPDPRVTRSYEILVVGDRVIGEDLAPRISTLARTCVRARNLSVANVLAEGVDGARIDLCGIDPTPNLAKPGAVEAVCELLLGTLSETSPP